MQWAPARWAGVLLATALAAGGVGCSTTPSDRLAGRDDRDSGDRVEVVLGLARHQGALERDAAAVAAGQRKPLTLAEVAQRYGASAETQATVTSVVRGSGGTVRVDATGALARVQLSERDATELFGASWHRVEEGGATLFEPTAALEVPSSLRDAVTEVIGVPTVVAAPKSSPVAADELAAAPGCGAARDGVDALRAESGLDRLTGADADGAGARVALVADQRVDRGAFDAWLMCIGHDPVSLVEVSAPGGIRDDDEIQLDLSALTAALPGVERIEVVGTHDDDWVGDPLAAALTSGSEPPQVISTSVTYCELDLPSGEVELTEHVLAAATAVGTVVVAASGDHGSTACAPERREAAVAYPASSPFALGVGGTDATGAVWSDVAAEAAGGGGPSTRFPGRTVPDVAGLAAPADVPPIPVCTTRCTWRSIGGTSFAAPFVAGALARVGRVRRAAGAGPIDVGLGRIAERPAPGEVTDVTVGGNDIDDVGCCNALAGFDSASGWGVLRFDRLAAR